MMGVRRWIARTLHEVERMRYHELYRNGELTVLHYALKRIIEDQDNPREYFSARDDGSMWVFTLERPYRFIGVEDRTFRRTGSSSDRVYIRYSLRGEVVEAYWTDRKGPIQDFAGKYLCGRPTAPPEPWEVSVENPTHLLAFAIICADENMLRTMETLVWVLGKDY